VPHPHSAVGLTPRLAELIERDSRRTAMAKIPRRRRTERENRTAMSVSAPKSPLRIDITPPHRDTRTHDHQNHILHVSGDLITV